jgi:hypothetical protein
VGVVLLALLMLLLAAFLLKRRYAKKKLVGDNSGGGDRPKSWGAGKAAASNVVPEAGSGTATAGAASGGSGLTKESSGVIAMNPAFQNQTLGRSARNLNAQKKGFGPMGLRAQVTKGAPAETGFLSNLADRISDVIRRASMTEDMFKKKKVTINENPARMAGAPAAVAAAGGRPDDAWTGVSDDEDDFDYPLPPTKMAPPPIDLEMTSAAVANINRLSVAGGDFTPRQVNARPGLRKVAEARGARPVDADPEAVPVDVYDLGQGRDSSALDLPPAANRRSMIVSEMKAAGPMPIFGVKPQQAASFDLTADSEAW